MLVGFLYGTGAETLVLMTGALENFVPQQKTQNSGVYPEKQ